MKHLPASGVLLSMLLFTVLGLITTESNPHADAATGAPVRVQSPPESAKPPIPSLAVMEPAELARILRSKNDEKPLILQVGFRFLYKQGHISGAEYIGPASKEEGLRQLRERVGPLARSNMIVLYCGCCPWSHCPNIKPAYDALRGMGFSQIKVLHIEQNFGTNWVQEGFPTVKGDSSP